MKTRLEYKAELIESTDGDVPIKNNNYRYDFQVQLYEDSRKLSQENYFPFHHTAINSVKKDILGVCVEGVLSEIKLNQKFPLRITVEGEVIVNSESKN